MVTEKGFVPKKSFRVPVNASHYSKEFRATWTVGELTKDIHEKLKKHLPNDGLQFRKYLGVQCGYSSHGCHASQQRLIYVTTLCDERPSKNVGGGVTISRATATQ